jgi:hypothetical protein
VEDSELHRSRRLLSLPPVILEPPPPPLRRKLDHIGSFEATGAFNPEQPPEESTANLGTVETSDADFGPDVIIPIQSYECLLSPNPVMEQISGNSSIPIIVVTTGEASPNLPLSTVRATTVSAATMSQSGPTPSIAAATPPYTPSATGASFSYGMPSSGTSPALTSSISQTLGLGAGSSNASLQGQLGGIPTPFNAFPCAGGHIPPSSPSLDGLPQQSAGLPTHTSPSGAGSQGQPAQTQPVGLSPFVWNGTVGNNIFASDAFPSGGTPIFGQSTSAQGTIPALGAHIPGPWNSAQGSVPSSGMSFWGNSFHSQWNPGQASMPLPIGPTWGNPSQSPSNTMNAQHPMSFMGNQQTMSPQMQNPFAGQGNGFYQNPGQQPNFS